jgi:hypothetical protein
MQKEKYPLINGKKLPGGLSFPSSSSSNPSLAPISSFQKFNNFNNSEPLNSISQDLTFKGSSLKEARKAADSIGVSAVVKKFSQEFGETAAKHFDIKIKQAASHAESGLKVKDDKISFEHKSFGKRLKEILLYPIVKMPLDIANAILKGLKKIPALKKSKTIDKLLDKKPLKNRREFVENTSNVAAIEHYFEMAANGEKGFKTAHGSFNPLLPNYSTATERTVTRLTTGLIPAFFLANDAYNLSTYMKNNKDMAEKDKKRRFNQEVVRVGLTAGLTFGVLSIFAKKSNASASTTAMLMSGAAFVSEFVGRMIAGTPIFPVGEKSAQYYASKRAKSAEKHDHDEDKDKKAGDSFKGFDGKKPPVEYKKPPEKGALTFSNVLKVAGALVLFGYGVEKFKGIKPVKEYLEKTNKRYKEYFEKDFTISRADFNKHTQKLRDNGFEKIADEYDKIVKDQTGDTLKIGKSKQKAKHIIIDQIIAFPVKFAWDSIVMLPYKLVKSTADAYKEVVDTHVLKKAPKPKKESTPDEKKAKDIQMLKQGLQYLQKIDKLDGKEYKGKINNSILSGLDNVTKSNYSNAKLSSTVRTATSTVTSAFLVADNYNMVMIESNGQNKDLAEQKAKERTIQRAVRIAYGAFLISMVNDIFRKTYNGSLLGAQLVNVGNTLATETMERKSVGLPLGESSREQIIESERENLKATGIKGGYFRLMAKLTGKKSLSEAAAKKLEKEKASK